MEEQPPINNRARHYFSKDSPEMKNIFDVTRRGLDFNRDYTMMNPGKLTKYVNKHPGYSWNMNEDLDGDNENDIVLYNSYGEPVYFNGLHIGPNRKTRTMYNYYNATFKPEQPYTNMRMIDGKKNENYVSFTNIKQSLPQRPDKEIFKPIIKEIYDNCIENLYLNQASETEKKEVKLNVMRACPYTAFYAFIVKYCIKLIYANGNVNLLEDKNFLKQVNEKLKTLPRTDEIKQAFTQYFKEFVWPNVGNAWVANWFHGYLNKNVDEKQQATQQFVNSLIQEFKNNPNELANIKRLLRI